MTGQIASNAVAIFSAMFLLGAGIGAGWKAAGANDQIDRRLTLARREADIAAEAAKGEDR